jgi:hypothetical protein
VLVARDTFVYPYLFLLLLTILLFLQYVNEPFARISPESDSGWLSLFPPWYRQRDNESISISQCANCLPLPYSNFSIFQ